MILNSKSETEEAFQKLILKKDHLLKQSQKLLRSKSPKTGTELKLTPTNFIVLHYWSWKSEFVVQL